MFAVLVQFCDVKGGTSDGWVFGILCCRLRVHRWGRGYGGNSPSGGEPYAAGHGSSKRPLAWGVDGPWRRISGRTARSWQNAAKQNQDDDGDKDPDDDGSGKLRWLVAARHGRQT